MPLGYGALWQMWPMRSQNKGGKGAELARLKVEAEAIRGAVTQAGCDMPANCRTGCLAL